ncbi:NUDIX domain-containing protein [Hymenobacter psychrotolerans]|uniref:GDP-mannose pyrophosphatase n=1 Tax=Hymenobacter psychrotolerans DSM 18569 TaxID=1121959 RepID=A0A1M6UM00_9BACT|nr:NUDIX hydrolase [Hymenobacter psychrotolerans]SHK70206.1 ADP-ribose pyrophosphatase [Hymenobacter psychrotolerans DSM 18569]
MKITDRKTAYDGHFKLRVLTLQDGDDQLKRERFEPGRAVAALVWDTQQQQYLLTRQYRIGPESQMVELPAGMIDGDEAPEAAIRREVQEELGYDIDQLEQIARIYPSPGTSAEIITVFFAEVSHQSGQGGGLAEEHEKIELVPMSRTQLQQYEFEDAKTILAVQWAQLNQK